MPTNVWIMLTMKVPPVLWANSHIRLTLCCFARWNIVSKDRRWCWCGSTVYKCIFRSVTHNSLIIITYISWNCTKIVIMRYLYCIKYRQHASSNTIYNNMCQADNKTNYISLGRNPSMWALPWQLNHIYLKVKVHGQRPLYMVHNSLFLGDLPTHQISKAHIKRQKSICTNMRLSPKYRNLTLRSKFKVIGHYPWYMTHRL